MSTDPLQKIRVWDVPTRVFHWLTALSFAGAYVSAESERWRLLHVTLGYTLGGLVVFRLIWGFIGTQHARFASFVRGPGAVVRYVASLRSPQPVHYTGHNPAGALAIVLMLTCAVVMVGTGWGTYNDIAGEWLAQWHALAGNAMLVLVCVHLAGVLQASLQHHENLARAMVTGYKRGSPGEHVQRAARGVGAAILLAVLCFWWWQWRNAP